MRAFFIRNFGAKQNVTREKLPKRCLCEKREQKTLMKLTSNVNFINNLREKAARKMLVKLAPTDTDMQKYILKYDVLQNIVGVD